MKYTIGKIRKSKQYVILRFIWKACAKNKLAFSLISSLNHVSDLEMIVEKTKQTTNHRHEF